MSANACTSCLCVFGHPVPGCDCKCHEEFNPHTTEVFVPCCAVCHDKWKDFIGKPIQIGSAGIPLRCNWCERTTHLCIIKQPRK